MPKTKFQDFIFTIIMVFTMVYCMTCYNMALEFELSYETFINAIKGMWFETIVAFFAQKYIAGPLARKLTSRVFTPGVDKPIFILVAMACFTVCIMAPVMTLSVAFYHHGFVKEIIILWLEKLLVNFPFALIIQIFYVGPLVRLIFRTIFREKQIS